MFKTKNLVIFIICLIPVISAYAQAPFVSGDLWKGEYVCAQGRTPASLKIRQVSPSGSKVIIQGIFDFGGGALPRGTYLMSGDYDPQLNKIKLTPAGWLARPGQYIAVGIAGSLVDGQKVLVGTIEHVSCGEVRLYKEDRQAELNLPNQTSESAVTSATEITHSQRLAQARNSSCMGCHDIKLRILGPSFKEIAAKYSNNPAIAGELTRRVLYGSVGNWGKLRQPAMTDPKFIGRPLTEQEVQGLVEWILTLK